MRERRRFLTSFYKCIFLFVLNGGKDQRITIAFAQCKYTLKAKLHRSKVKEKFSLVIVLLSLIFFAFAWCECALRTYSHLAKVCTKATQIKRQAKTIKE